MFKSMRRKTQQLNINFIQFSEFTLFNKHDYSPSWDYSICSAFFPPRHTHIHIWEIFRMKNKTCYQALNVHAKCVLKLANHYVNKVCSVGMHSEKQHIHSFRLENIKLIEQYVFLCQILKMSLTLMPNLHLCWCEALNNAESFGHWASLN